MLAGLLAGACGDSRIRPGDAAVTDDDAAVPADAPDPADAAPDAPSIALTGDTTGAEGAALSYTATTANLPAGARLRWMFSDGSVQDGVEIGRRFQQDGDYSVVVDALVGNTIVASATLAITITNVAPTLDLGADRDWVPGRPFELDAAVGDPGLDTITAMVDWGDGVIEPVVVDHERLRATHAYATDGDYVIAVTVADEAGGAASDQVVLDVFAHPMIFITPRLPSWGVVGTELAGRVDVSDLDARPLTLSLAQAPIGMTLDADGLLRWTPGTSDAGTHAVTLSATDGTITKTAQVSLVISGYTVHASALVTAAGGGTVEVTDVTSPILGAKVRIPAGALAADTTIQIATLQTPPSTSPASLPGPVIELLPTGTTFATQAELTLPYGIVTAPAGVPASAFAIQTHNYFAQEGGAEVWYAPNESVVDMATQQIRVPLDHFSTYRIYPAGCDLSSGSPGCYQRRLDTVGPGQNEGHFTIVWSDGWPVANDKYSNPAKEKGTKNPNPPFNWVGSEYQPWDPSTEPYPVPFYIQDLAYYLEKAHAEYLRQGYPVRGPGDRYIVAVGPPGL